MSLTRFLLPNALISGICALLGAGPLAAAVLHVASGGVPKAPDPDFTYQQAPFDCTPLLVVPLTIGNAGSLMNDTTGGPSLISGYPCAPWFEVGPEHIYQLEVAAGDTLQFWAGLTNVDDQIDHDLFLLNGCDTDSCLIGANTELSADLTGGTYYLIVDGANGDEGPYSLDYSSRYVGVSPFACLIAAPVETGQGVLTFPGNLFGLADFVQSYECNPTLFKGGEKWYTLTLPPPTGNQFGGQDFSQIQIACSDLANTLDVALWLFDGCGTSPTCLDFVNDHNAGIGEQLTYRNETDQDVTLFLGVDSWRNPSESGTGFYTITFTPSLVVPTEKTSFGSLRALYR